MVDMIDMLSMVDKGDGNLICKFKEKYAEMILFIVALARACPRLWYSILYRTKQECLLSSLKICP
jgi:hypothetical protein